MKFFVTLFLVYTWTMGGCIMYTGIRPLLPVHPFISSFFFIPWFCDFSNKHFSSHFFQEPWGLEDWNLVHTWTVDSCIMYTGIRLLLPISPFIFHFSFSPIYEQWNFSSHFSWYTHEQWVDVSCIPESGCCCLFVLLLLFFFSFLSLQFSNIKNILLHFSQELWGL